MNHVPDRVRKPYKPSSAAIIFDVDGVLVDSYQAHFESWRAIAAESRWAFSEADFAECFGQTSREIIRRFSMDPNLSEVMIEAADRRKEALYRALIAEAFPAMPGAAQAIRTLHSEGFSIALGSSGPAENVELAVRRLEIGSLLDAIVTGNDVRRGKPDPEVFLTAASRMELEPAACVVVEDSPPGVEAALAADMPVICLLSHGHQKSDYARRKPTLFIDRLGEITPELIRSLLEPIGWRSV